MLVFPLKVGSSNFPLYRATGSPLLKSTPAYLPKYQILVLLMSCEYDWRLYKVQKIKRKYISIFFMITKIQNLVVNSKYESGLKIKWWNDGMMELWNNGIHPYGLASLRMTERNPYGRTAFSRIYMFSIINLLFHLSNIESTPKSQLIEISLGKSPYFSLFILSHPI